MELRRLRYFVAVAKERHFARAAGRLHIAAPSLSQQIRALERDLHAVLFDRSPREVQLTPADQVLLAHARALLARAEWARDEVRLARRTPVTGGSRSAWPPARSTSWARSCANSKTVPHTWK